MDFSEFLGQFHFRPELAGAHGIEREFFLMENGSTPVPRAAEFLDLIADPAWTYELSACQAEHRTKAHLDQDQLYLDLQTATRRGEQVAADLRLRLVAMEVAPYDMPLDVYPRDDRYQELAKTLPTEVLRAAMRVAGVHIHRGVRDMDEAIRIHNLVAQRINRFQRMGDHSQGERLRLYELMAKTPDPPLYRSAEHFCEVAHAQGFADKPRSCYHWVRISPHGTVELRMFGMTPSAREILGWIDELEHVIRTG